MNDWKIVELIKAGKSDTALDALYKHFPLMRKMVVSKGGTATEAEDVFQEALIILVKRVRQHDFELTARLSTYLYSVCRYLWKDEHKKHRTHIAFDYNSELPLQEEEVWLELTEQENKARLAAKALEALKDRCRELLLLFYSGRFTLRDIAGKMGYSSENTAKNQKYKCLESAKNKLSELKQSMQTA
ncbi:RNA polymerase sigma factor, sigma-70 family [Filimonas lacunae]|uniref:RNA polymerase sigma factor, sigma-70 family n=1 Tax=Filimonas lacunae TaxID=477680 RepID=A0A173MIF8_9BACT|nr:sigma-70 family RNA polymerase sigma factor [Filimonas lacunae]BAV07280.1 RNA polymerase sigma-70 factor, ECF subfamily [Filimonas lacunae]SIS92096.1 RNA polymerase sigma factor, sigma-70 family [Filimonas lacunae]